jgi:tetraacyldisaccharide 4'-kinase
MKAPKFWQTGGWQAAALSPFEALTQAMTARRMAKPGFDAGIAVFCAGNASVGGSGKTILTRDLLRRLPGRPFALTRGYGGRLAGPVLIDLGTHGAADVGDEALLLAATAPTILARDRAAGARLALAEGATAIVMDDGLQNPGLKKTASFLVIDGGQGFGNGHLLPAGPLREPIAAATARCAAAVLIGADATGALARLPPGLAVLRADLHPACATLAPGARVIAFAGIGRPDKFFCSAADLGFDVLATVPFPDHHKYSPGDEARLMALAAGQNAQLVTTEKDRVKLSDAFAAACHMITVRLAWADEPALNALIARHSDKRRATADGPPGS